jgi:hypothetical protein
VNRWLGTLVSTTSSNACPQNGHWIFPETSIGQPSPVMANRNCYNVAAGRISAPALFFSLASLKQEMAGMRMRSQCL